MFSPPDLLGGPTQVKSVHLFEFQMKKERSDAFLLPFSQTMQRFGVFLKLKLSKSLVKRVAFYRATGCGLTKVYGNGMRVNI